MTDAIAITPDGGLTALRARAADYPAVSSEPGPAATLLTDAELLDIGAAEILFGLPKALLITAEELVRLVPAGERAAFARDWTTAVDPDGDFSQVTSEMILWLLDDAVWGATTKTRTPGALMALAPVIAAHRKLIAGEPLARAEWGQVRRETMSVSVEPGEYGDFDVDAVTIQCAENAAWPPATSGSVFRGTLGRYVMLVDSEAYRAAGFTAEDMTRLNTVMEGVWEQAGKEREAGHEPDMDALFSAADADLAQRWARISADRTERLAAAARAAAARFVGLLSSAPRP